MTRKQAHFLKIFAEYLHITQGEVMGLLLDVTRKDLPNAIKKYKTMVEDKRTDEEKALEKALGEL